MSLGSVSFLKLAFNSSQVKKCDLVLERSQTLRNLLVGGFKFQPLKMHSGLCCHEPRMVQVCSLLHQRYEGLATELVAGLTHALAPAPKSTTGAQLKFTVAISTSFMARLMQCVWR